MKRLASTLLACTASTLLWAQDVQWASRVIEFSSELTSFEYSASQVLGKPNVLPRPGDSPNAWLAREPDEIDFVKVGFDQPMKIRQIAIAESYNPSSLYRVYIYDQNDKEELLNTFIPKPIGLKGRMLNIYLSETAYPVAAIKIVLNGKLVPGYSGIDAIGISSSIEPIEAKIAIADNVRDSIPTIELAKTINSTYQESRPLIAPDGKTLFFSRRFHPDNIGGVYDAEDIWYSEYDEATGEWQESKNIGAPLNNANSNFISSITPDGNSMVVILGNEYRKGDKMKPGISISTKTEEGWTKPENVEIERAFIENLDANYFLSNDRKILVMGIERFDSQGGKDLYVSFKMESGNWSEPLNIGSTVNTSHDEYSPYLAPDNETLYFSSKGFSGFGGSDVYITRRLDNTWKNWSDPENLGPDINSEEDEVFFNITPSGQQAYFAKGTGANADIYRIDIPVFYQPSPVITVRGLVKEQTSEKPLSAQVLFTLMPENTQIGLTISDSASGEFNIVLPSGAKYIYTTQADGYKSATQEIDLMKNPERHEYQEVVWLEPEQAVLALVNDDQTKTENTTQETPPIQEPAATGTKQRQAQQEETQPSAQQPKNALALKIYFYFDSNELSKEQKRDLKSVYEEIKVLKADIKVEIAGHTDNVGSEFYNVILSERRAKAVQDYLISLGLTAERLVVKGYGESQPAATNNHLEGRRLNRRVEFVPQN